MTTPALQAALRPFAHIPGVRYPEPETAKLAIICRLNAGREAPGPGAQNRPDSRERPAPAKPAKRALPARCRWMGRCNGSAVWLNRRKRERYLNAKGTL